MVVNRIFSCNDGENVSETTYLGCHKSELYRHSLSSNAIFEEKLPVTMHFLNLHRPFQNTYLLSRTCESRSSRLNFCLSFITLVSWFTKKLSSETLYNSQFTLQAMLDQKYCIQDSPRIIKLNKTVLNSEPVTEHLQGQKKYCIFSMIIKLPVVHKIRMCTLRCT